MITPTLDKRLFIYQSRCTYLITALKEIVERQIA